MSSSIVYYYAINVYGARERKEVGGIVIKKGIVKLETVNKEFDANWSTDIFNLINEGQLDEFNKWYKNGGLKVLDELN